MNSATPALTLNDLAAMIQRNATKEDIQTIVTARIEEYQQQTDEKIEVIRQQVDTVNDMNNVNANKIEELQATVESLKQEQIKSNICFSGVPANEITENNTAQIVINIAKALNVTLTNNQFTSYAVANKKFIVAHFYNHKCKRDLLMSVRAKRSLMVEEVFTAKSNSQIYLNDHLTPYFNKLHILAREAKKAGKLATVSSYGGKIRVRKTINEAPIVIMYEAQLQTIIDTGCADSPTDTSQHASDTSIQSTSTQKNENAHKHTQNRMKPRNSNSRNHNKNKATNNTGRTKSSKRKIAADDEGNDEEDEQERKRDRKEGQKPSTRQRNTLHSPSSQIASA